MTVRRKTLLILAVTFSAFVGILYIASRTLLLGRFTQLERDAVRQDVDRSSAALSAELQSMDALALDNASWDAAYDFMLHPSPKFIRSAFGQTPNGAFYTQGDDFLLFVSPYGSAVGDTNFDLAPGDYSRLLQDIRARLNVTFPLIQRTLHSDHLSGILVLPEGPLLLAARPVLPSSGKGTPDGVLIIGRFFNDAELRRLDARTSLKVSCAIVDRNSLEPDFATALRHLPLASSVYVAALDATTIAGYKLVPDVYGNPALILKTDVPRKIYQAGRLSMFHFAAALLLAGIVFGGIVQLLLERSVASPLAALNATVEQIAVGVDESHASVRHGRDELATLGNAVHRMIDAVHRSEKQRDAIEARHRIFMNNLPAIAAIKDQAGRYIYFNEPMARTFHLSIHDHLEKPIEPSWLPADVREQIHGHELEVMRIRRPMEFEETVPTPDGTGHYWLALRFPLTEPDGQILIGMVAIDITARKRAEAELRAEREKAEIAFRTKSEFLASISHEVRTPINSVIGMTDLALESALTPEQREFLTIVKSSARELLSLFNDIIDFSRIEAGTLDFEHIDFSLRGAIESIVRSQAAAARDNKIDLVFRFDDAAPDAIRGDPTRLRQLLVNLLQIVFKATQSGEVIVSVDTEMQTEEEVVLHFSVHTPAQEISLPRVSSSAGPSTDQAFNAERQLGGSVLGAAISSRLVELMGGRIWADCHPGQGSSIDFNARFDLPSPFFDAGRPAPMSHLRDVRVIVADDNPANRRILADMLTSWRMRPTLVAGGEEAMAELDRAQSQNAPFKLALLDGRLLDMDGFTLAEKIQHHPNLSAVAVILLASAGLRGDAARCRDLGIKAYLPKPVVSADLLDAIRRIMSQIAAEGSASSALLTRHSLREARRRLRILIAEDNAMDRTLAVRLLEKRGYTVETAETGKEVLEALERQPFDAILMDVQMPDMDGLQATAVIRNHERLTGHHVPIIAMTAYAMSGDRERCLAAGMDRYIPKPLNVQHLYQTIDELSGSPVEPSVA